MAAWAAMARRLVEGRHDVGVYNRTADKIKPLTELGAKPVDSIHAASNYGEAVFTMLADDAAVTDVVCRQNGLLRSLPKGGIHICAGTHSVVCIRALKNVHGEAGQVLIHTPMLGRPEVVASGQAGTVGGAEDAVERCRPLFAAIARRHLKRAPIRSPPRRSRSPIISCSAAPSKPWARVLRWSRKYNVVPDIFYDVMTEGLFACAAYKIYGKIIAEQRYLPAG